MSHYFQCAAWGADLKGWETRSRGGRYYSRTRRENGRIVREYVGTGPLAEAIAALDARDRAYRQAKQRRDGQDRERQKVTDRIVSDFYSQVEILVRAALEAGGYHQHARGEWRKRRG